MFTKSGLQKLSQTACGTRNRKRPRPAGFPQETAGPDCEPDSASLRLRSRFDRADTKRGHTARACSFLRSRGADRVLLACGTASAIALDFCKRSFTFPIHGVLESSVLAAIRATKNHRIGVAATEATVKSGAIEALFGKYDPECTPITASCPSLVELIEAKEQADTVCYDTVRACLSPLRDAKIDTLILGCTHFAWLRPYITAFLPSVSLIESGKEAALSLCEMLSYGASSHPTATRGRVLLYTTASARELSHRAQIALQRKVKAKAISKDII